MAEWNCNICKEYQSGIACTYCDDGSEFERMNNADRIRSMSDEELAGFLDEFDSVSGCDMCSVRGNCHAESNCIEGFLGWLKSEAKE